MTVALKVCRIPEYGTIHLSEVGDARWRRLQRFDAARAARRARSVFDWSRPDRARARSLVGVVQVEGLRVEIFPKIDAVVDEGTQGRAQANLLHMLRIAKRTPIYETGLAGVSARRGALLEALVSAFAARVLDGFARGPDRGYRPLEERTAQVRGRILVQRQAVSGRGLAHKIWVRRDEFDEDTPINQTIKAACSRLLGAVREPSVVSQLVRIVEELDGVSSVPSAQMPKFHRNNRRWEAAWTFARMVLADETPDASGGDETSFALVFPMERLFEEYFARLVIRNAVALGLDRSQVRPQAGGRFLLESGAGTQAFQLRPDIIVRTSTGRPLVVDTKWKTLKPDGEDAKNGLWRSDAEKMVVYATRWDSDRCVLVYPHVAGVTPTRWTVPYSNPPVEVRVETFDVSRDLRRHADEIVADLQRIIHG